MVDTTDATARATRAAPAEAMGPSDTGGRADDAAGDLAEDHTGDVAEDLSEDMAEDLRLVIGRLARRIRQHQTTTLTPSQHSALASIERLAPVRLCDLAAVEGVSSPTLTKIVAGLEDTGLVDRAVDPADRRSARLQLTDRGAKALLRIRTERTAFLRQRLEALDPAARHELAAALPVLTALIDDDRAAEEPS